MAIAHEFEYTKPATVEEAIALLEGRGAGAMILAGGTDVIANLRDELIAPELLVDIKGIPGMSDIKLVGDTLFVGPLVTFSALMESKVIRDDFPVFYEMATRVASRGVRNRATVAGNICSAVPCCDAGPVLLVHDARVHVMGPMGERSVPMTDWFAGSRKTALQLGEIVVGIAVPAASRTCAGSYVKLGRYRGEDLAQASVAILVSPQYEYRIAYGSVGPTPRRAKKLEGAIRGQEPSEALFEKARKYIPRETSPITDIRATAEYRAHMLNVMFERGAKAAVARLLGDGPPYGAEHI
ncbi:MAG: xanthine dehydrogenase family protein subunit M [Armatimonadetes bacterium]|nr:xanthine dehydrogenase family protein subunit M [Armatimonadota bacterium]